LILNSEDMVKLLTKQKEPSTEEEEEMKLTLLMEQRLQCILLALAKLAGKFKGAGAKEYVQTIASLPCLIYFLWFADLTSRPCMQ
jgi:hypothetical protein